MSGEPLTKEVTKLFSDIGIIKAEYICKSIGQYVTMNECQETLFNYISLCAEQFSDGEVWYRFIEMTAQEINVLDGTDNSFTDEFEDAGLRGVRRAIKYPATFQHEMDIIKNVLSQHSNVNMIIPFITDVSEVHELIRRIRSYGIDSKIGGMIETPAAAICIDELIRTGLDNVTVGLNDLTFFTMASMKSSELYDRSHPALTKLVQGVIDAARKHRVQSNVTGYLDKETFDHYYGMTPDSISIFYHNLPLVLPNTSGLPYLDHWRKLKEDI